MLVMKKLEQKIWRSLYPCKKSRERPPRWWPTGNEDWWLKPGLAQAQIHETNLDNLTTISSRPLKNDHNGASNLSTTSDSSYTSAISFAMFNSSQSLCWCWPSLFLPYKIQSCITKLSIVLSMIHLLIVGLIMMASILRRERIFVERMTGGQSHHLAKDPLPTEQDKSVDISEDFAATSSPFPDLYLLTSTFLKMISSLTLFPSLAK